MHPEIKFCGMTRAIDAREAMRLGARYVGGIFAGGPRLLDPDTARALFASIDGVNRVGVFGAQSDEEILETAAIFSLDVVQLHGDARATRIDALRRDFDGEIWPVLRIAGAALPSDAEATFASGDAVLLDAHVDGMLGGTGVALPWGELSAALDDLRSRSDARLVLAGGLRPENVATAIRMLAPDVVDVSSGVEASAGVKDHARMRAFSDAVKACR